MAVSSAFGRFADKRELQTDPQDAFDYSQREEIWIDFLSDTGDGFEATYTMAWLLAQPELDCGDGLRLPRGDVLLLGGDQVYPAASVEAYEDHFIGPFAAALPTVEDESRAPHLYAVPGNHDWYDGLTSFLRVFCRREWIGGWRQRQGRSYFALRLPHRWWIWAIDIQLDTYLDGPQLAYFEEVANREVESGDRIILVTAKPSWVHAEEGETEPASWRYLSYFEERYVRRKGAQLVATLTGDLHHYSRYQPEQEGEPIRITAGGGGAYLSATHTLPRSKRLKSLDRLDAVDYRRAEVYPQVEQSKRLARKVFVRLPLENPSFCTLMACVYTLLAATTLGALNLGPRGLVAETTAGDFLDFLASAASGATVVIALVLVIALAVHADVGHWVAKGGAGLAHAVLHLTALEVLLYFTVETLFAIESDGWAVWAAGLPLAFAAGLVVGPLLFTGFLFGIHVTRRGGARNAANDVFASQGIVDYKNLVRMHLHREGQLTIYSLGVDRACRHWDFVGSDSPGPSFVPREGAPTVRLIDRVPPLKPSSRRG